MALKCKRCGSCCYVDLTAYICEEDLIRWRNEKRYDILKKINEEKIVWAGDKLVPIDGKNKSKRCSFLVEQKDNYFSCSIYETRPIVCQNFEPGKSLLCPQYGKNQEKIKDKENE